MRSIGVFLSTLAIAFGVVAIGETQQPKRGGTGGPGGFGQRGNALTLIQNPQVQKELNLSEEQIKKLPDAVQKALAEVLDPKQAKRLKQIQLQQRGSQALTDAAVAKELKISESQKEQINTILTDSRKQMQELFQGGGGRGNAEKFATLQKETRDKVLNVLNDTCDEPGPGRHTAGSGSAVVLSQRPRPSSSRQPLQVKRRVERADHRAPLLTPQHRYAARIKVEPLRPFRPHPQQPAQVEPRDRVLSHQHKVLPCPAGEHIFQ
jgi:hypothetical protein